MPNKYKRIKYVVWEANKQKYGKYTCEICKKTPLYRNKSGEYKFRKDLLTVDHILERRNGGGDTIENLRTCCGECNQQRDVITDQRNIPSFNELLDRN